MDWKKVIIDEDTNIREALQSLDTSAKRVLFVEKDGRLVGAVSDGDIRRWILKNGSLDEAVSTIMNRNPIALRTHDREKAFEQMRKIGISAIPVIDEKNQIQTIYFWVEDEQFNVKKINTEVVVMAGGKGERLLPYTSIVPKPLLPIGDKTIIEHIIDSFIKYGCNKFTFTINYKKNMIKAYFDELERDYEISYIEETKPMGTGGSLSCLKSSLKDTFFVSNCDILLDVNYSEIYDYHKNSRNIITIVTSVKNMIIPYGTIILRNDGTVSSLIEKPKADYLINTGVYVIEPKALDFLVEDEFLHITDLIEKCINNGEKIGIYPISQDAWMDMGQFDEMEKMKNKMWDEKYGC